MSELKKKEKKLEPFGFTGGQLLKDILEKQPDAITDGERDILKARRDYLTKSQRSDYGLDEEMEVGAEEEVEEEVEAPADVETSTDEEVDLDALTNKELRAVAEEMEVDLKGLSKNKDIIKAIKKAEKKASK